MKHENSFLIIFYNIYFGISDHQNNDTLENQEFSLMPRLHMQVWQPCTERKAYIKVCLCYQQVIC